LGVSEHTAYPMEDSRGLSVCEIRKLEERARRLGFSERLLIENASSNLASILYSLQLGTKVLVIAGGGNNGADVLACSRKLLSRAYDVRVVVLEERPLGQEAQWQRRLLEKIGVSVIIITSKNLALLGQLAADRDFILEGIIGIGIKGEVAPFTKSVIIAINGSNKKIVACDVPSGLSADEGVILGAAIRADYTITFIAEKKGFFLNQGPAGCGKIIVTDIGISKELLAG